jgi:acetyl esterase/lipase
MKSRFSIPLIVAFSAVAGCDKAPSPSAQKPGAPPMPTLREARKDFVTNIVRSERVGEAAPQPPHDFISLVHYDSPAGKMAAYICKPSSTEEKRPAIIWLVGGFSSSISEIAWTPGPATNDQSGSTFWKSGIITMYPSYRGGNDNPGRFENFFGEVDDVIAAAEHLAKVPGVDPNRIYLGGHSTGGTLAMLVAEITPRFRAVFAFGPSDDVVGYGDDVLVFNTKDPREGNLRAPIRWMHGITTPTFVFEGSSGRSNVASLRQMSNSPHPKTISFHPVSGADHFSALRPISSLIASKILADTRTPVSIHFDPAELSVALKR